MEMKRSARGGMVTGARVCDLEKHVSWDIAALIDGVRAMALGCMSMLGSTLA